MRGQLGNVLAQSHEYPGLRGCTRILRYTKLSHDVEGETFDASSFGGSLAVVFPLQGPALGVLSE